MTRKRVQYRYQIEKRTKESNEMATQVTVQKVAAVLRKAGFVQSKVERGRLGDRRSQGFVVGKGLLKTTVEVSHNWGRFVGSTDEQDETVGTYVTALLEAGIELEVEGGRDYRSFEIIIKSN